MAEYGQVSDGSVITLDEGSGEHSFQATPGTNYIFNWFSRPETSSVNSDSEIRQAHLALSTAYTSLKTRLLKSETENQDLKRELKSMHSYRDRKGSESPTHIKRTPPNHDADQADQVNGILRQKPVNRIAREDGSLHQRHGSWGYTNDHLSTEEQYCKLMEIQLNKVEEERNRLQTELKEVRLKLTEMSLKSDQSKRSEQQPVTDQSKVRELERKLGDAELQKIDLRKKNETLQRQLEEVKREKESLQTLNRSLEQKLRDNGLTDSARSGALKEGDVDVQTQIQKMTVLALQAVSDQQRTKSMITAQQNTIKTLQAKLLTYTNEKSTANKGALKTKVKEEHEPLICQAESDELPAQGDAFGEYYMQKNNMHLLNGYAEEAPNSQSPLQTPKQQNTPKQASQHVFAFEPIRTSQREDIDGDVMKHKSPYQLREAHFNPNFEDLDGNVLQEGEQDYTTLNSNINGDSFMGDEETTMTRVHSEDITINLDPTTGAEKAKKSVGESENPPPVPCRRIEFPSPPHQASPAPVRYANTQANMHGTAIEPTETSTSSDDVPVRRPPDSRTHGYVNVPRLDTEDLSPVHGTRPKVDEYSHEKTSTGVHGGLHMLAPTDKHYRQQNIYVEPRAYAQREIPNSQRNVANTETGSPDVRPKVHSNSDPNFRINANPYTNTPHSPRKSNTLPTNSVQRPQDTHTLPQSLPRQRAGSSRDQFETSELMGPPLGHSSGHHSPRYTAPVAMTTYDGPPKRQQKGHQAVRNEQYLNVNFPGPVENSESEDHDSFREKTNGETDLQNCIICNKSFGPKATLKEKEEHVNACLIDSARSNSAPQTPECPVCKRVFPVGFSQIKFEAHVHQHFGDNIIDRYEIIDADSVA